MSSTIDWLIDVFIKSMFLKMDNWLLVTGVSFLGLVSACWLIWFIYRSFT